METERSQGQVPGAANQAQTSYASGMQIIPPSSSDLSEPLAPDVSTKGVRYAQRPI